ncbi:MAG: hypothetical protein FWC47_06690 [Oscillospiraceae bacterium]|nr:hypothetical protein [Oscillospiraceae bacterium]
MIELLKLQIIPAIVGIIATFLSWLFVKYFFSPKLQISEYISKKGNDGRVAYRVKIMNCGYRMCSDIKIYAKLEVKGLEANLKNNYDSFYVDVSFNGIYPVLKKGKSILLHIYNKIQYDKNYYSDEFSKSVEKAFYLEDLFNLTNDTNDTKLIIYVTATDNFSGVRKLYISKEYKREDIKERIFNLDNVLMYSK